MARIRYAYQGENEGRARAIARGVRISPKEAYEISNRIRGMKTSKVKVFLENVTLLKEPVPYKRFNKGIPHRKGKIAAGRFPVNASKSFLKLVNEVEVNAEAKGLNRESLVLEHVATHRGRMIQGRFKGSRHNTPTTHIEMVVKEGVEEEKPKTEEKKEAEAKPEEKPKKEEKK